MAADDAGDTRLIEECDAFRTAFAHYIQDCAALADLETNDAKQANAEGARRRATAGWQAALCRVSHLTASTSFGLFAKSVVLQDYLAERPVDDPCGMGLVTSLITDLQRLLV